MIPALSAIALAVSKLSPVHITTLTPETLHYFIESTISSLKGSCRETRAKMVKLLSSCSRSSAIELYSARDMSLNDNKIFLYAFFAKLLFNSSKTDLLSKSFSLLLTN